MFNNSPSICYTFFAIDDVIVTWVNTYMSMMGKTLKISTWSNLCQKIKKIWSKAIAWMFWVLVDWKHWWKNWQHRYCCLTYWVVV